MTILPQLERDLYDAASWRLPQPEATPGKRWVRRPRPAALATLAGVAVAVAVAVLALTLPRPQSHGQSSAAAAGPHQLLASFAILRRPQTAADRAAAQDLSYGPNQITLLPQFTRLAEKLPGGSRVFLTVGRVEGPNLGQPIGSYLLTAWVVSTKGGYVTAGRGPTVGSGWYYRWFPVLTTNGPRGARWLSIVPDGVTTVGWSFGRGAILASVDNNVAIGPGGVALAAEPGAVIWHNRRGEVLKTLIAGAAKAALYADGIASARFGEGVGEVVARLSRWLGPPATSLQRSACGPVETISWRAPITIYFRDGRFVAYAYGSQTPQALPEPVLVTARGLVLGESIAQARRQYGPAFHTSEEQGGTWFLNTPNGTLDGFRNIAPQNEITTIQAGPRICAALSP